MRRRWFLALAVSSLLALGAASATSLGVLNPPVAQGLASVVNHCEPTTLTLVDGLLGPIPLGEPGLYSIDEVELTGLTPACEGQFPAVVVIGNDLLLGGDVVLGLQEFTATSLPANGDVTLTVEATDPLGLLNLDLNTIVTDVRVVFCDAGSSCL